VADWKVQLKFFTEHCLDYKDATIKNWIFKFGLTSFPSKNHENRRKIQKNRSIDETIHRLIFWKEIFLTFPKW
jgi:hypothetical protein